MRIHQSITRMYIVGSIATLFACLLFYYLVPRIFIGNTDLDNVFLGLVMTAATGALLLRRKQHLQASSNHGHDITKDMAIKSCLNFPQRASLGKAKLMVKGMPRVPQHCSLRLVYSRPLSR